MARLAVACNEYRDKSYPADSSYLWKLVREALGAIEETSNRNARLALITIFGVLTSIAGKIDGEPVTPGEWQPYSEVLLPHISDMIKTLSQPFDGEVVLESAMALVDMFRPQPTAH